MHQGVPELVISIFSFVENFSMNTANHVKTPCVLTRVTYSKSYYRKSVAFLPSFLPSYYPHFILFKLIFIFFSYG